MSPKSVMSRYYPQLPKFFEVRMTLITSRNHSSIKDQPQKMLGRSITHLQCRMAELAKESKRIKNDAQDSRKFMSGQNMVRMDTKLEKIDQEMAMLSQEISMLQGRI